MSEDSALAFASARIARPRAGASTLYGFRCLAVSPNLFECVGIAASRAAVMSIAVSVIVRPSFGLRVLHAGLCCCVMASAAVCQDVLASLLCVLAGVLGYVLGRPCGIARRLDISGVGPLRLTVYQASRSVPCRFVGATLWPVLLLLRLSDGDGGHTLLVLPDSVARADWRALSLACRAVAGRAEIKTPTL